MSSVTDIDASSCLIDVYGFVLRYNSLEWLNDLTTFLECFVVGDDELSLTSNFMAFDNENFLLVSLIASR